MPSQCFGAKSKFQLESLRKNYKDSYRDTSTSPSESVKSVIPLLSSAWSHRNRSGGSDSPDQQSDDSDKEIGAGILEVMDSLTGPNSTAAGQLCQSVADIDQDWMAVCTEEAVSFFCALRLLGQIEKLYQADCLAVPPPPIPPTAVPDLVYSDAPSPPPSQPCQNYSLTGSSNCSCTATTQQQQYSTY
jgi:hypothetical protein